jgi:hypothetical protein
VPLLLLLLVFTPLSFFSLLIMVLLLQGVDSVVLVLFATIAVAYTRLTPK